MVSDSELIDNLREFLRTSDLNKTTTAIVRRKLEEDFGIDLSDKKVFIREQVDLFLQSQTEKTEEDDEETNVKSEDSNTSDSEEEEEKKKTSNGRGRKKGVSNKLNKDVKKRGGGSAKVCSLSPQLQKFVGVPELARTEVVRQLWAYIHDHNLQDPNNKRNIICDEVLRTLFPVDTINMFQMNKSLSSHIWPLDSDYAAPNKSNQKEKQRKQERREGPNDPKPKEKRQKRGGSGFLAPLRLSDALMKFIGTGESELPRASVVKKMWEYIKQNGLQFSLRCTSRIISKEENDCGDKLKDILDPSDKRRIICDDKLKELLDVESFNGFTVPKLLAAHFIKPEQ